MSLIGGVATLVVRVPILPTRLARLCASLLASQNLKISTT